MMKSFPGGFFHTNCRPKETGLYLHLGKNSRFAWEFVYGHRYKTASARIHFGNRGSETPFDAHLTILGYGVFFNANFPGLAQFAEFIGRGHKRDISLSIHDGKLWWRLWYDDDGGNDDYHRHNKWDQPKVWPWSRGRKKYRPWMCLRDGNIDLNPVDAWWGSRYHSYEDLESAVVMLNVNEFDMDIYPVAFTLQKVTCGRRYGPAWARKVTQEGYVAAWDCERGIPTRNHSWKGDGIHGSAEKVSGPENWIDEAVTSLIARVKQNRIKNSYRPPMKEA